MYAVDVHERESVPVQKQQQNSVFYENSATNTVAV